MRDTGQAIGNYGCLGCTASRRVTTRAHLEEYQSVQLTHCEDDCKECTYTADTKLGTIQMRKALY